jgi:hypothetical protein
MMKVMRRLYQTEIIPTNRNEMPEKMWLSGFVLCD